MNKKFINLFAIIRVVFYIFLLVTFALIDPEKLESKGSFCSSFLLFNYKCPSCGVTRSFCNFMHLNFSRAFYFNKLYTISIFPLAIIIMIDEFVNLLYRLITKKQRLSLFEYFIYKVIIWN